MKPDDADFNVATAAPEVTTKDSVIQYAESSGALTAAAPIVAPTVASLAIAIAVDQARLLGAQVAKRPQADHRAHVDTWMSAEYCEFCSEAFRLDQLVRVNHLHLQCRECHAAHDDGWWRVEEADRKRSQMR